jgi:hypothetical protein
MAIKKRTSANLDNPIENLANELADKPYGQKQNYENIVRTTITLPASVLFKLEDIARSNKREKDSLKSVSAVVRYCIKNCLNI